MLPGNMTYFHMFYTSGRVWEARDTWQYLINACCGYLLLCNKSPQNTLLLSLLVLWVTWAQVEGSPFGFSCGCRQMTSGARVIWRFHWARCLEMAHSWLTVDAGWLLGAQLTQATPCGLPKWLGLFTAWWPRSLTERPESQCSNRQKTEAAKLFKSRAWNWHIITSSIFYSSKQS